MYCIVDIETTGNGIKGNRITEISIFKFDGYEVVDEFTSLVDPECEIPFFITGLTGIDNETVRGAPKLEEIANKILEITKDCIFVAHSVNFDYNVIKHQLQAIGLEFSRKKLCTVRLSRKLLPGYRSYSLGKLCTALSIPLENRHRARGDAHATVLLFQKLLRAHGAEKVFKNFLNARSQEATLPPSLPKETFLKLPSAAGVYYFRDGNGTIIYVGKAINIKKRVLGHFYDKSNKEVRLCQETAHIDFELSGSNLLALLMESTAIKKHFPKYNRAQKKAVPSYGIFAYENRRGVLHLAFNKLKSVPAPLATFYSITACRSFLQELCDRYALCPRFCQLQEGSGACSHYLLTSCKGICNGEEATEKYNDRVHDAISEIGANAEETILIKEKGRSLSEEAFVLLKNGAYCGYGFIDKEVPIRNESDIEGFLMAQKSTLETESIIRAYLNKGKGNCIALSETVVS